MSKKIKSANVMRFQTPFERLKSFTSSPDVSLRRAIITQAIIDATNVSECRKAKKIEQEAKLWIFGGDECFKTICMEGGIEPSFVKKVTKDLINIHNRKTSLQKFDKGKLLEKNIIGKLKMAM